MDFLTAQQTAQESVLQKDIQDLLTAWADPSEPPASPPKAAQPMARGIKVAAEAAQAAQRELKKAVDNVWRLQKALEKANNVAKEAAITELKTSKELEVASRYLHQQRTPPPPPPSPVSETDQLEELLAITDTELEDLDLLSEGERTIWATNRDAARTTLEAIKVAEAKIATDLKALRDKMAVAAPEALDPAIKRRRGANGAIPLSAAAEPHNLEHNQVPSPAVEAAVELTPEQQATKDGKQAILDQVKRDALAEFKPLGAGGSGPGVGGAPAGVRSRG